MLKPVFVAAEWRKSDDGLFVVNLLTGERILCERLEPEYLGGIDFATSYDIDHEKTNSLLIFNTTKELSKKGAA